MRINFTSGYNKLLIKCDEYSVHQIFRNLIDNSIKYTPEGTIDIIIDRINGAAVIKIIDTGIGISNKYITQLFNPFTQEEQGFSRKYEGSGLGLSLVKKYVDINNAQISVVSEKNNGSTFTVTFNLVE